ncbi:MAG: TetR/AcrR family transcriptional regulator [Microthrixaceae bacterium]|jgi:AcrR family transcriptional regulator|nr:TetR/AcrR family transcriptional regulator [Actinomycetota bacterium]MBP6729345.1 TetR/AcrR family transcriptional regulator [Microthrixaceae bacterium]HMT25336.1 TetR/AcrR family transcriptional regulator [Microthrixaceae bacterium]HMT61711.1 TetR/AcrR family transcriptional regulator [Microthrixaceae bacterium]
MRLPAAERREQLLRTAIEVFGERGYHNASMNDVAEAAGVTKPVLYHHFASKRDMYKGLLVDIGTELEDLISKAAAQASGPREQIIFGFRAYFSFVEQNPSAFRVLFGAGTRRDEEFAAVARRVEASIAEVVASLIEVEGLSPERRKLLGNGIVALAEGSCRYWLEHSVAVDAATLADDVSRLAWAGLRGIR